VKLGILGPLLVIDDAGRQIQVSAPRQRALFAALLVRANHTVSAEELAEIVWDGAPPDGADCTLRTYVMRLRRVVGPQVAARILTRDPGYLCQVAEAELDALQFAALSREAGAALRAQAWSLAATTATRALNLCRAQPLLDVASQSLREEFTPYFEQLRFDVLEGRIEADLRLGAHDQLVPELRALIVKYPLRERLHAQLMLALAGTGRQAEALEAYRDARRVLVRELGVEPGARLRDLHRGILAGDPALVGMPSQGTDTAQGSVRQPGVVVPRQLPAAVRHFIGRNDELKALTGLVGHGDNQSRAVVIAAIDGMAGVGKTALAVHWAHQHAALFPDGQLYVNLRGFDPSGAPVTTASAVRRFLDALAVPAARIPSDPEAQLDLYRSLLVGKRILVVLDNARDGEQVRPLLPGAAGCMALITSRNRLPDLIALEGAIPLTLRLLTDDEARELLARRLGAGRVTRQQPAADELIELCSHLPLALNLAAARAAVRPDDELDTLAAELRDAQGRLDLLSAGPGGADVRAVFSWSYRTLSAPAARLFRLLGVHPGPDIAAPAAASLAALPLDQARGALEELTAAHLLTEPTRGRYGMHDLLRAYANNLVAEHETEDAWRDAALRVLDHYVHTAAAADRVVDPKRDLIALTPARPGVAPERFADPGQAWQWYEAERPALLAAVALASAQGFYDRAWQLSWALATFLHRQGHWQDQIDTQYAALEATRNLGDTAGEAYTHRVLGRVYTRMARYEDADTHLRQALALFEQLGDQLGQAHTLRGLAWLFEREQRFDDAIGRAQDALSLFQRVGHRAGEALALNAVGWLHVQRGDYHQALAVCHQALNLDRELGDHDSEANALESLGYAYHRLGRHADAITAYRQALPLLRESGSRYFVGDTLDHLGDAHEAAGDHRAARQAWDEALAIMDDLQHPDAIRIRAKIGSTGGPG